MSASFQKLRSKLAELFQLDAAAELDFGIYRILNARRVEVEGFLDNLQPQVDIILSEALQSGTSELKTELEKVEAGLRAGGFDEAMIATAPKVKELREKIATSGSDPTALTHDIFSHLTTFFSRYYKDGDFLSLRRYKRDTYAIPYEGEEVKLHWANADQYYIKSAENFRDYTFKLSTAEDAPRVTFKLVEADTQKDNTKATAGQERRFVYQGVIESDDKAHLTLGFAYLPLGKDKKQAELNKQAIADILNDAAKGLFVALAAPDKSYTGKKKEGRTLLEKHLTDYTARNTFDYFIHKDLGGFLRRELDFYIKNEVLHLDDLDEAPETNWRETRARLKALRAIAGKVIRFLAQIEDFQKKLWLKKKFVTACDYVVTLDRIPEALYPEIAACEALREEWVRLFAIDEIKGDLGRTGYSVPLTVEFLKENQGLPVDTRYLTAVQKHVLGNATQQPTSVVFRAENLHMVAFAERKLAGTIQAIYVDPPYNTKKEVFPYKDGYTSSAWLGFVSDRINHSARLLSPTGVYFVSTDDNEHPRLQLLIAQVFGKSASVGEIVWHNARDNNPTRVAVEHEYVTCFAPQPETLDAVWKNAFADAKEILLQQYDAWKSKGLSAEQIQRSLRSFIRDNLDTVGELDRYKFVDDGGIYTGSQSVHNPHPGGYDYDILHPITGKPMNKPANGYRFPWETMKRDYIDKDRLLYGEDEDRIVQIRVYLKDYMDSLRSVINLDGRLGSYSISSLFGVSAEEIFKNAKPPQLIKRLISFGARPGAVVCDFFAGSGTTGHAAVDVSRETGHLLDFVLCEMGEHFDTVLVPRLKKVIYSKDWKDGKPQSRNAGISHCFKVLRLESYEDTLNNLRLHRSRDQELALESMSVEAREEYQLGYMLDLEATGSQSLLNVSAFTDPFGYSLNIATGTAGETKPVTVDLVETFNWLLGLTVLAQGSGGGVTWIEGTNPEGEKVLVLWRNTTEVDAEALNAWCKKQKVSVLDGEFSLIYINGDHHLENLRRDDQTWKVRLTDEEFPKLMWEGCE